jgi:hypothetical protein
MARNDGKLFKERAAEILSFIRAGAFPLVAAEAAGVPRQVYEKWLEAGEKRRAREPFRSFARDVRKAVAGARILQEHAVYEKDPKYWLVHGPGKDMPGNPGWTGEVRPLSVEAALARSGPARPEWESILTAIRHALADHPEASQAVAEALSGLGA